MGEQSEDLSQEKKHKSVLTEAYLVLSWGGAHLKELFFTWDFVKGSCNRVKTCPDAKLKHSEHNIVSIQYRRRGNWRKICIPYSIFFCISRSQILAWHHRNQWCLVEPSCWPAHLCYLRAYKEPVWSMCIKSVSDQWLRS